MGQVALGHAVEERTQQGTHYRQKNRIEARSNGYEQRPRTSPCKGPTHSEYSTPQQIPLPAKLVIVNIEGLALQGDPIETPCSEVEEHTAEDGTAYDAIHVEGIKTKHLLNPEPTDHFSHREGDAENQSNQKQANYHKRGSRVGRMKEETNKPPVKKPTTAMRLGHCRELNPLMA